MKVEVVILGNGGHARVLLQTLDLSQVKILGYTSTTREERSSSGISYLGTDEIISAQLSRSIKLVNGIGGIRADRKREHIFNRLKQEGFMFLSVIHPQAYISSDVYLDEGVQIMVGALIQPGTQIGANSIVNTGAIIDHDCIIGSHVHISPGAVITGGVKIEDGVHVGAGATIIQGVRIGMNSTIGAGSVVIRDVLPGSTVVGVPAKEMVK